MWKYETAYASDWDNVDGMLKALGSAGWELVSAVREEAGTRLFLKRRVGWLARLRGN